MSSPARPTTPTSSEKRTTQPTYAQVAASPPRTPKQRYATLHPSGVRTDPPATQREQPTLGLREQPSPSPNGPGNITQDEPHPTGEWSDAEASESSIDPDLRDFYKKQEEEATMHYGYPTLEDWKNLSVHGNDSMCSETVRDCLGESIHAFGGDLEKYVTDGMDRHGKPLPGQELAREEERKRKRQKMEGEKAGPKKISIRFRKYRPMPSTGLPPPFNPFRKVQEWVEATDPKPTTTNRSPAVDKRDPRGSSGASRTGAERDEQAIDEQVNVSHEAERRAHETD